VAADTLRRDLVGNIVSYVGEPHINFTHLFRGLQILARSAAGRAEA